MKPRLLVVDDEADVVGLLEDVFGDEFDVLGAGGAAEAEALLSRERDVAVAIVDYMMPGGDGLTLIRSLRERGRDLPVVLYSAFLDSEIGEWTGGLKVRVISKSAPVDELVQAVRGMAGLGA